MEHTTNTPARAAIAAPAAARRRATPAGLRHALRSRLVLAAVAGWTAIGVVPAWAVNKCALAGGKVVYQDHPCDPATRAEPLYIAPGNVLGPSEGRPRHILVAIAAKRAVLGMTASELERAIGKPQRINLGEYEGGTRDQLVYEGDMRKLYVYLTNGIVTAIQDTDGGRAPTSTPVALPASPTRRCPSANDMRNIEVEMSKLEHRGKDRLLAELQRQLGEARACGR